MAAASRSSRTGRGTRAGGALARRTPRDPRSRRRAEAVVEETRELLLAAAEDEFARHGYEGARLEDIAERVRVSRPAVVYHFGDKGSLYALVLRRAFQPLEEGTRRALALPADERERIVRIIDVWLEVAQRRPNVSRLFLREIAGTQDGALPPVLAPLVEPLMDELLGLIRRGQRRGVFRPVEPAVVVSILAGAIVWFVSLAPTLATDSQAGPQRPERFDAFRAEVHAVAHHLLGLEPAPRRRAAKSSRRRPAPR